MKEDALRWNMRYKDNAMPTIPSTLLLECEPFLRELLQKNQNKALDIACGNGRNSKFLSLLGFEVDCVDISEIGLSALANYPHTNAILADLDTFSIDLCYDVICDFYFLNRRLFPQIRRALNVGGIFIFESFSQAPKGFFLQELKLLGSNRCLESSELAEEFEGFKILFNEYKCVFREGLLHCAQMFVVQKIFDSCKL